MQVDSPADVRAFLADAGDYLAEREAEHNLLFGICSSIEAFPEQFTEPPRFAVVRDGDRVVGAALQTPPMNVVLSEIGDDAATDALADAFQHDAVPGVTGPTGATARFAARWSELTGHPARIRIAERTFRLSAVRRPRAAPGRARLLQPEDRAIVSGWLVAFAAEALGDTFNDPDAAIDRWLSQIGGRQGWIWDDGGPVSFTGIGGPTPNGIRLGPVYTPPSLRGRGYAGNLVAAASQAQLDRGRRFVFLFTDLANPTSNHIYQEVGYEPITDIDMWMFEPG